MIFLLASKHLNNKWYYDMLYEKMSLYLITIFSLHGE